MELTLVNGFWMSTTRIAGNWSASTSIQQQENANIIRSFFINEGWTLEAICGMLGCMQGESTINPAFIQATNRNKLPNGADELTDVPNSVMINFYMQYFGDTRKEYAIGLIQWDGYSTRNGVPGQKLVNYAMSNNINWYDGWTQLYRIRGEWQWDIGHQSTDFFKPVNWEGTTWTYANYPTSTMTPESCASVWTYGVERNKGGPGFRPANARLWYDWFTGPDAPELIPPEQFLEPLPADTSEPPFDPEHPQPVDPDGEDYLPAWLFYYITRKKLKEGKQWRKI